MRLQAKIFRNGSNRLPSLGFPPITYRHRKGRGTDITSLMLGRLVKSLHIMPGLTGRHHLGFCRFNRHGMATSGKPLFRQPVLVLNNPHAITAPHGLSPLPRF